MSTVNSLNLFAHYGSEYRPNQSEKRVAYFCMEYGLSPQFKIYSGGLGILAGDILKAAHDLKKPLVGIGLLWKQGYTDQIISTEGKPVDTYQNYKYEFLKDTGVKVKVRIRTNDIWCKVWLADTFDNAPLLLLDTDIPENADRWITGQLYGWFAEERVAQEMVLGIGGVRALRALNIPIDVYHFNEGHAVLAGLELIRENMQDKNMSFDQAVKAAKGNIVFTTHTPIKEGNEHHQPELLTYMQANMNLTAQQMHSIGGTPFNMTVAALHLSRNSNAVAVLHAETATKMWEEITDKPEIIPITNGIHRKTWVAPELLSADLKGETLWQKHLQQKNNLITFVKDRTGVALKEDILLVGFSRRAALYKRGDLLFSDLNKISSLFKSGKLQIIFSGKAHPMDDGGKSVVSNLVKMSREFPQNVVFLQNYDMTIGAQLTRGCDVWLNNPRRPLEACGTSGMKAAMNGVLNLSILDGWWPEACQHGVNGWAIGDEKVPNNVQEQDERDASFLYETLTKEVIPTYYEKHSQWVQMMEKSISSTTEAFCAETMVKKYYSKMYEA